MKSKEEIEQLALNHANEEIEVYNSIGVSREIKQAIYTHCLVSYNIAYTQFQEDMADKWFEYPKNIPPIHSENYLVFVDGYIEIDLFRGDHNKFNSELYNKNCTITHWKLLPNKPLNKQD